MAGPGTDGTKAGAARRRHSKRLLPRWRARCARRRCNHSAGEPNHRALRTPSSACPVHAGLASAGDETLQGIWRGLAGALHPGHERRPIPSRPADAKGSGHPLEGNGPEQDSYSAFQAFTDRGRDLESTLHELDVNDLFICGLATDYCVRATTLDGLRRGLAVRVLRDAIRGVDLKPGDSDMAIKEMRVHGARFSESRGIARLLVGD